MFSVCYLHTSRRRLSYQFRCTVKIQYTDRVCTKDILKVVAIYKINTYKPF